MVDVVIIGQNEGRYIQDMHRGLGAYPYDRYWVLDRCTDDSAQQLIALGERFVCTPSSLQGRQTSFARNLGLAMCNPKHDVLFLDGDRYIATGSLNGMEQSITDIVLLMVEDDFRVDVDFASNYGRVNNFFYSCGIFMKRKAIDAVLKFQNGELFSTEMQDVWGIEDTYLGDVCYHLGLTASIYDGCRLRGGFERGQLDSIYVLERRLRKRDNLNVLWE